MFLFYCLSALTVKSHALKQTRRPFKYPKTEIYGTIYQDKAITDVDMSCGVTYHYPIKFGACSVPTLQVICI